METLTLKRAKELSILKWTELAGSGEMFLDEAFEQDLLKECVSYNCGFCEYQYRKLNVEGTEKCVGCRLLINGIVDSGNDIEDICCGGLYKKWAYAKTTEERKEFAQQILALIESIEV